MARLVCLIFKRNSTQFFCLAKGNDYLGGDHSLKEALKSTELDRWSPDSDKESWYIHDLAPDKLTGWLE